MEKKVKEEFARLSQRMRAIEGESGRVREEGELRNRLNRCKIRVKWSMRQAGKGNKENNMSHVLLQVRERGFERYTMKVKQ